MRTIIPLGLLVLPLPVFPLAAQEQAPPAFRLERTPVAPTTPDPWRVEQRSFAPGVDSTTPHLRATAGPVSEWTEKAENLDEVIVAPSPSYPVVQSEVVAEGTSAFQLINVGFGDIAVELAPTLTPGADTRLFFQSRLGLATSSQIARAQVRVGAGGWTDLWSLAGSSTGFPSQDAFELVEVDLSSYAGQTLSLRFFFEFTSGSAYTQAISGWFIDNIQIGAAYTPDPYDAFGDPSAEEILVVEFINRARADANAEAIRLRDSTDPDVVSALNFFSVDTALMLAQFATLETTTQPLAINGMLTAATRSHSEDMLANQFQGHFSSNAPIAPNQPGDSPGTRAERRGFGRYVAENVFAYAKSLWHAHAGFNIDWGTSGSTGQSAGGMQNPPGHRQNIHNPDHREIGIGIVHGTNGGTGPILMTQNLGFRDGFGGPFLVGVTMVDADGDAFYDLGEGLGGVRITVAGGAFFATSSTEGAYAIPLPGDGDYVATFERDGFALQSTAFTVTAGQSVKLDYHATAAASPITFEAVTLPTPSTLQMVLHYAGAESDLTVERSDSMAGWAPVSASISALGEDRFRVEVAIGAVPTYFRVVANP